MSEIDLILGLCSAGLLGGSIENCIVVAYDSGNVATATNAAKDLTLIRSEIERLKAERDEHKLWRQP